VKPISKMLMTSQPLLVGLTVVNVGLAVFTIAYGHMSRTAGEVPVLRGRALEIVDDRGEVRASIKVHPASRQNDGALYPETVLLRLITEQGRPAVKISTSEHLSGLAFAGPSGTRETYVQLLAQDTATLLRLKNEGGRERVIEP
jgi:hypothetical protein